MSVADKVAHARGPVRLRAKWVLPIDMPPIEDGEVVLENGRITAVTRARSRNPEAIDFGAAAILPGFVNVHAHLEYTLMRGLIEEMPFFPWVRSLTQLKAYLTLTDWTASATLGAGEMLAAGVTTIVDAADAGATLTALIASGHRGIVCREVFGIEDAPSNEVVLDVLHTRVNDMYAQLARAEMDDRLAIGISPHAPYTIRPGLFPELARYARGHNYLQTIHIAETPAEAELIRQGTGPFAEMFDRRGIVWDTPGVSPVRYVDRCGAFEARTLAVHCVQVDTTDAELLAARGVSVAHCPKSNGKLATGVAPLRTLLDAGVAVGLGTDSMVSNNAADIFEEMRLAIFQSRNAAHSVAALSAPEALQLATLGGARAIGMDQEIGSLRAGKRADLCVARLDGLNTLSAAEDNPIAALVFGARTSDIALTMVEGSVLYESGKALRLDLPRALIVAKAARANLWRKAERVLGTRH